MKLPINLLLSLGILALLSAIGLQFKGLLDDRKSYAYDSQAMHDSLEERWDDGKARAGDTVVGPNYGGSPTFWDALQTVNLIGKEPPEPVDVDGGDGPDVDPQPVEVPKVPLEDIFTILGIMFDGDGSKVIIQYKPEADVMPPDDVAAGNVPLGGGPADVTARGGRSSRGVNPRVPNRRPQMPSAPAQGAYTQLLSVGESLWENYQHIRLARVADDAGFAVFRREDPQQAEAEWAEEPLYPEVLGLQQDVLEKLSQGLAGVARAGADEGREPAQQPVDVTDWQPTETTREVASNRFHVGTNDQSRFRQDPNRIFNEDIGSRSWSSRYDGRRGVQITRISPELSGYGVQTGDVILSINGEPVANKTQAITVGKRLHKRGVRNFSVEFLSGGRTVTRTYVAPD